MYLITIVIFFVSLILPWLFLLPLHQKNKRRTIIIIIQLILFFAWALIYNGVLNGTLPNSFGVWGTDAPESSVFMINWLFEPIVMVILAIELLYLLICQFQKIRKK